MPFFSRTNSYRSLEPVKISVQVETQVEVADDGEVYSHGLLQSPNIVSTVSSPQSQHTPLPPTPSLSRTAARFRNMSLPRANYDPRRVCLNPFPEFTLGKHRRTVGIYLAGALFALANWTFLDAAVLSAHAKSPWGQPDTPPPVHMSFVDWIPGICSLFGYIVITLIDKDRVRGDEGFGESRAVWTARTFLFIGFALMAGGLAGSITVLVLKYIMNNYPEQFKYYGYANVSQSLALMLSVIVLWFAQNTSGEYEYNLTL